MDHCALCMMIMASIFLSGLGWVGLFCKLVSWVGLGCVHQLLGWVGLGWITENGPTSMSGLRRVGYISPLRSAYPHPKPQVTLLCMWGPMGDVITHAQFQLNRFSG